MKSLEFNPQSEPVELFEVFFRDFVPDIFSALRKNTQLEINSEQPLSTEEVILLFQQIMKSLNFANGLCKKKYKCTADSIKVEMRIRNDSFVWFRLVPLDKFKEPITEEKENYSFVLPNDTEQMSALIKEGYTEVILFSKLFPPKN